MITPLTVSPFGGLQIRYLEVRTILDWPGRPLRIARMELSNGDRYKVTTTASEAVTMATLLTAPPRKREDSK